MVIVKWARFPVTTPERRIERGMDCRMVRPLADVEGGLALEGSPLALEQAGHSRAHVPDGAAVVGHDGDGADVLDEAPVFLERLEGRERLSRI